MNRFQFFLTTLVTLFAVSSGSPALADVKLPAVLDSQMVIQRGMPVHVWGWADAGEEVSVILAGTTAVATTDQTGKWQVKLPAMKADGKTYSMMIQGKNKILLEDILVGDVWIGSGQSNMEWPLKATLDSKEAIAAATRANIRLFHVPKKQAKTPADDVVAEWKACTPENIPNFSAVLYYFGLKLNHEVEVPIGLINSSWGGSPIEPWTTADGKSGGMYNGMIAPLQPFAIRGTIWYQGETNVINKNGLAYHEKMNALIGGWRQAWGKDFPFYFVQIAPWSGGRYEPGQLPALWEAQVATLKTPGTGMAVTTDLVDNVGDIHPRNKIDVGNRLAFWALAKSYNRHDVIYSGPLYQSMKVEGNRVRLQFAHVGQGLKSRDENPLNEFQIAGSDGEFVDAKGEIDGKSVVVFSEKVNEPVHVRFGWHKLANPNLVNSAGLPASPFQTNNWTGGTGEAVKTPQAKANSNQLTPTHASVSYGKHDINVLDFWEAEGDGPRPLLVYIHGGGWVGGDKKRTPKQVQTYLAKGISYAAINYRLTGDAPLPAPVHDAARAIQFIRSKANEWNIDKSRIALTGGSAGACTSMWILLHDDLADPNSDDLVLRESTRVSAAAVAGGQTSIDPKVIEGWLGPNVLQHKMINMAVGEPTIEGAIKNYDKHRALFVEFSPYNHLDGNDPPLFMSYGNNMKLPSESAGHGIHHPVYGVKMKEKADRAGHECYLLIKNVSEPEKYANAEDFLMSKLLAR